MSKYKFWFLAILIFVYSFSKLPLQQFFKLLRNHSIIAKFHVNVQRSHKLLLLLSQCYLNRLPAEAKQTDTPTIFKCEENAEESADSRNGAVGESV